MCDVQLWLQAVGLFLDMVGVIGLFFFGLPPDVNRTGLIGIAWNEVDIGEIQKGKKYEMYSKISLALIVFGFALQLVAVVLNLW